MHLIVHGRWKWVENLMTHESNICPVIPHTAILFNHLIRQSGNFFGRAQQLCSNTSLGDTKTTGTRTGGSSRAEAVTRMIKIWNGRCKAGFNKISLPKKGFQVRLIIKLMNYSVAFLLFVILCMNFNWTIMQLSFYDIKSNKVIHSCYHKASMLTFSVFFYLFFFIL